MSEYKKASNMRMTPAYLQNRSEMLKRNNWPKSKWIFFCEELIKRGFVVSLYEARETKSKYCKVKFKGIRKSFKVRFSDHKPSRYKEKIGDCDFFVGMTNTGTRTTQQAIDAVYNHFGTKGLAIDNCEYIEEFR